MTLNLYPARNSIESANISSFRICQILKESFRPEAIIFSLSCDISENTTGEPNGSLWSSSLSSIFHILSVSSSDAEMNVLASK